jgi:hypothetical protein
MKAVMELSTKDREVLDRDYSQDDVRREEVAHYAPLVQRGSYRLAKGYYRTAAEQRDYFDKALRMKLPRQPRRTYLGWLRKLFR